MDCPGRRRSASHGSIPRAQFPNHKPLMRVAQRLDLNPKISRLSRNWLGSLCSVNKEEFRGNWWVCYHPVLQAKTSSTPKATASPSLSFSSMTNSFSFYKNPLQNCNSSTPQNSTPLNSCTPVKSDIAVNVGQKRKVLEMLQSSPPRYTSLSSFIG